jgi:hypothetical protein
MVCVPVAVRADLVPAARDLLDQVRMRAGTFPENEERRTDAQLVQGVEHPRGPLGVGAVVEGQRDARGATRSLPAAQLARERGEGPPLTEHGHRGNPMPRDHCTGDRHETGAGSARRREIGSTSVIAGDHLHHLHSTTRL